MFWRGCECLRVLPGSAQNRSWRTGPVLGGGGRGSRRSQRLLLSRPAGSFDARLTGVLENLRRASQDSHLPLFEAAAAKDGTLTVDELHALER